MSQDEHDEHDESGHPEQAEGLEAVQARVDQLPPERLLGVVVHRLRHLEIAVAELRALVPKAFQEGFARRVPEADEPWLADWLTSDTKRELESLVPRGGPPGGDDA